MTRECNVWLPFALCAELISDGPNKVSVVVVIVVISTIISTIVITHTVVATQRLGLDQSGARSIAVLLDQHLASGGTGVRRVHHIHIRSHLHALAEWDAGELKRDLSVVEVVHVVCGAHVVRICAVDFKTRLRRGIGVDVIQSTRGSVSMINTVSETSGITHETRDLGRHALRL
jgi:hypothetical protein